MTTYDEEEIPANKAPVPPVWTIKSETDTNYNRCARVLVDRISDQAGRPPFGIMFATHNQKSCELVLQALVEKGLVQPNGDQLDVSPHVGDQVQFAQLYGEDYSIEDYSMGSLMNPPSHGRPIDPLPRQSPQLSYRPTRHEIPALRSPGRRHVSLLKISFSRSNIVFLFEGHTLVEGPSRILASLVVLSAREMSDRDSRASFDRGCSTYNSTITHPGNSFKSFSVLVSNNYHCQFIWGQSPLHS